VAGPLGLEPKWGRNCYKAFFIYLKEINEGYPLHFNNKKILKMSRTGLTRKKEEFLAENPVFLAKLDKIKSYPEVGNVRTNFAPFPFSLSNFTSPPIASVSFLTTTSPKP